MNRKVRLMFLLLYRWINVRVLVVFIICISPKYLYVIMYLLILIYDLTLYFRTQKCKVK